MTEIYSSLLTNYIEKVKTNPTNSNFETEKFQNQGEHNDTVEIKKTPSKKRKIAKIALFSAIGVTLLGAGIMFPKYKGKIAPAFENIKKLTSLTGEKTNSAFQNVKKQTSRLSEYESGSNNITNIKDLLTNKYLSKIPFYKKFDQKTSDLYRKSLTNTMQKSYFKAHSSLLTADDALLDAVKNSNLSTEKADRLKDIILKRQKAFSDFSSAESISSRIKELDGSMKDINKEGYSTVNGIVKNRFKGIKNLLKRSIGENTLNNSEKIHSGMINEFYKSGLTEAESKELAEFISGIQDKSVLNKISRADKSFEKAFNKEAGDMLGKLRDINFGCAPTDVLGIAGSAGLLGLYTAQADSKEEKVKVSLTTGIPLIVSLGTTVFATTKMINGFKSLALGGATGLIASAAGKILNKKYQERHNIKDVPNSIETLDDYIVRIKEKSKEFMQ